MSQGISEGVSNSQRVAFHAWSEKSQSMTTWTIKATQFSTAGTVPFTKKGNAIWGELECAGTSNRKL